MVRPGRAWRAASHATFGTELVAGHATFDPGLVAGNVRANWMTPASVFLAAAVSLAIPAGADVSLPRILYPGTYGNYCGPTPEVRPENGVCMAHGWRGDSPIDSVDATCRSHDFAYCACKIALKERATASRVDGQALPGLTALRSLGPAATALRELGADEAYLQCSHAADEELIRDGIRIRAAAQRSLCASREFDTPSFFCDMRGLTLKRVEQVDFDLFLSNLDTDFLANLDIDNDGSGTRSLGQGVVNQPKTVSKTPLLQLEAERRAQMSSGRDDIKAAANSPAVLRIEAEMLRILGSGGQSQD